MPLNIKKWQFWQKKNLQVLFKLVVIVMEIVLKLERALQAI